MPSNGSVGENILLFLYLPGVLLNLLRKGQVTQVQKCKDSTE